MKQVLLRLSGFVVGAVSALAAPYVLYVQTMVFLAESEWYKTHPPNYVLIVLWFGAFGIVSFLLGWLSYASFRYAFGRIQQSDSN